MVTSRVFSCIVCCLGTMNNKYNIFISLYDNKMVDVTSPNNDVGLVFEFQTLRLFTLKVNSIN